MPYNTPFKRLTIKDANMLVNPNYRREHHLYLDCLALLHDVITPYEYQSGIPVFGTFRQNIDRNLINSTAAPLQKTLAIINENVQANADTAFDLLAHIQKSLYSPGPAQPFWFVPISLVQLATGYNNRLLQQYAQLR